MKSFDDIKTSNILNIFIKIYKYNNKNYNNNFRYI